MFYNPLSDPWAEPSPAAAHHVSGIGPRPSQPPPASTPRLSATPRSPTPEDGAAPTAGGSSTAHLLDDLQQLLDEVGAEAQAASAAAAAATSVAVNAPAAASAAVTVATAAAAMRPLSDAAGGGEADPSQADASFMGRPSSSPRGREDTWAAQREGPELSDMLRLAAEAAESTRQSAISIAVGLNAVKRLSDYGGGGGGGDSPPSLSRHWDDYGVAPQRGSTWDAQQRPSYSVALPQFDAPQSSVNTSPARAASALSTDHAQAPDGSFPHARARSTLARSPQRAPSAAAPLPSLHEPRAGAASHASSPHRASAGFRASLAPDRDAAFSSPWDEQSPLPQPASQEASLSHKLQALSDMAAGMADRLSSHVANMDTLLPSTRASGVLPQEPLAGAQPHSSYSPGTHRARAGSPGPGSSVARTASTHAPSPPRQSSVRLQQQQQPRAASPAPQTALRTSVRDPAPVPDPPLRLTRPLPAALVPAPSTPPSRPAAAARASSTLGPTSANGGAARPRSSSKLLPLSSLTAALGADQEARGGRLASGATQRAAAPSRAGSSRASQQGTAAGQPQRQSQAPQMLREASLSFGMGDGPARASRVASRAEAGSEQGF